ncbi:MAG: ABC transporter ATP-binding protein [Desulfosarcinaceae bacterium]
MTEIHLTALSKHYGRSPALEGLDLRIAPGSFTVLVGPSGCGKTTTLRLLAGLETPSAGRIRFDGEEVTGLPPRDRDVAVVFQQYSLYGHLSVRENLVFGLRARRCDTDTIARRLDQVTALLKIDHLLDRRPAQLSGGEQQRVAIGRALARHPRAFLFDEPLCNLDAALRLELRSEIIRLHQAIPTTTVYVTHDQAEAMAMADTLVVMNRGRCVQQGAPRHLYHHPADSFVARFLGSPPMNLIEGEMTTQGEAFWFHHPGGRLPITAPHLRRRLSMMGGNGRRKMILGARPEHLKPAATDDGGQGQPTLSGPLLTAEHLGAETLVNFRSADQTLRANIRAGEGPVSAVGASLTFTIDPRHLHLFDAVTGRNLNTPTASGGCP